MTFNHISGFFGFFSCECYRMLKVWVWQYSHNAYLHSIEPSAILLWQIKHVRCVHWKRKLITRVSIFLISLCYHKLSLCFEASPLPHILAPFLQEPFHDCNCDGTDPAQGLALTRGVTASEEKISQRMWQKIPQEFKEGKQSLILGPEQDYY